MTAGESADACFSGPGLCWYIELFEFCGSFRDLAHESLIKGANHVDDFGSSHDDRIMTGGEKKKRSKAKPRCNEHFCEC